MWKRLAVLVLVGTTVGCDRVTKHFAEEALAGGPRHSFLADTVRLEYVENAGAFLALGADWPPVVRRMLFTYGSGMIMIGMTAAAVRFRWSGIALVGVSLYVAGGVSNLADRVIRGSVIDFLNVGLGPLRTGIFNVADMAIMLGVGLLIVALYRAEQPSCQT
jgi:signal peptidase II